MVLIGKNAYTPLVAEGSTSFGKFLDVQHWTSASNSPIRLWCVDLPRSYLEWATLMNHPRRHRTLIRYEPSVVLPQTHNRLFLSLFSEIIDIGRPTKASRKHLATNWPQLWGPPLADNLGNRSERVVVINGDKLSFINGELYSLRRKSLAYIPDLDLFGRGWRVTKPAKLKILVAEILICLFAGRVPKLTAASRWFYFPNNYLGATLDKRHTLRQYRYSLVIENSLEFLTEKLFDCFFAGTIPIYVGPKIEDFAIPNELVIQVEPNVHAIRDGIAEARKIDYEEWRKLLTSWLSNSETRKAWSAEAVFENLAASLLSNSAN